MGQIKILPEIVANQIAAGEVVERPASVVKELVENAIDAGATEIVVDIEGGGKRLIRVRDNGRGMDRDDIFLSLERHATSKVFTSEDIFALSSFGFRGEALPSISSVSRLTLRSHPQGCETGFEIYAEGGNIKRSNELGMSPGTLMEVRNLFFNTPARRKFLRKDETEFSHIAELLNRISLSNANISFRLTHNGRQCLELPVAASEMLRAGELLGRPLMRDMLPLNYKEDGIHIRGFIAKPEVSRSTTNAFYTYVNGRFVRDKTVRHAVTQGYRTLLMKGRYPVVIIFIDIAPSQVDVNVHPSKHEVRFRQQSHVHDVISSSIIECLRADTSEAIAPLSSSLPPSTQESVLLPLSQSLQPSTTVQLNNDTVCEKPSSCYVLPPQNSSSPSSPSPNYESDQDVQMKGLTKDGDVVAEGPRFPNPIDSAANQSLEQGQGQDSLVETLFPSQSISINFSAWRILSQLSGSYIVCEDGADMILIDQHAAHERIKFEKMRSELQAGTIARQSLLMPEMIEFDFEEAIKVEENLAVFLHFGFEIEPFGGRTYALKGIPFHLSAGDAISLVRDMVADIVVYGRSGAGAEAMDAMLMKMACHKSVRAHQILGLQEMKQLLETLDGIDLNRHCPHGRPIFFRMTGHEIERRFKRV